MTSRDLGDGAPVLAIVEEHLAIGTDRDEVIPRGRVSDVLYEPSMGSDDLLRTTFRRVSESGRSEV